MKARPYYSLVVLEDGRWGIHFGAYDYNDVMHEREDLRDSGVKMNTTRILKTKDDQESIDAAVAKLPLEVRI